MSRSDEEWQYMFTGLLLWYNTRYSAVVSAAEEYLEAVDREQERKGNLLAKLRDATQAAREIPPDDAAAVGHEWRNAVLEKIAADASRSEDS